jgi:hypothetical protein
LIPQITSTPEQDVIKEKSFEEGVEEGKKKVIRLNKFPDSVVHHSAN